MIRVLLVSALATGCAAVGPSVASSGVPREGWIPVDLTVEEATYPVRGANRAELRQAMNATGPQDPDDKQRYDALTTWNVDWKYDYTHSAAGCGIGPVTATLKVKIDMPLLDAPALDAQTRAAWDAFVTALRMHENGHLQVGLLAAYEIRAQLPRLPPRPSCEQVEADADALGASIIATHRALDADYDARTDHGATQGVSFR